MNDEPHQATASQATPRVTVRGIATSVVLLVIAAAILFSGLAPALEAQRKQMATEQLLECCRSGDAAGARVALDDGADANTRDEGGRAAIYVAIDRRHENIVEVLLDAGVDPLDSGTNRPLHFAITAGSAPCARLLLKKGADPNDSGTAGIPPLHVAISKGNVQVAGVLIEAGADIRGALDIAARCGPHVSTSAELARMLLRHGADPNENVGGMTPMQAAVHFGAGDVTDVLMEHGVPYTIRAAVALNRLDDVRRMVNADPSLITRPSEADHDDVGNEQRSLLGLAMSRGHRDIALWLIDVGAPVEPVEPPDDRTLLHIAAAAGDVDLVRLLIERGVDPNQPDFQGITPLARASGDRAAVIAVLIEGGADVNAPHPRFGTLLNHAARYHDQELVRVLLEHGADPTIPNSRTGTLPIEYMRMPYYTGERVPEEVLELLEVAMKEHARSEQTDPR